MGGEGEGAGRKEDGQEKQGSRDSFIMKKSREDSLWQHQQLMVR